MGAWVKTATIGAKAGTDIKDSGGNVLDNEDIRNDDLSINYSGTNIQIKKGSTQIGSNVDAPGVLKNATIAIDGTTGVISGIGTSNIKVNNAKQLYTDITDTKPPSNANNTVVAAGTDGRLTVATNGATAATVKVFSDAEITKLVNLRNGKTPGNSGLSILNSETTFAETTGAKPPSDANKVTIASGTDGKMAITTNGGTAANVNVYSAAEKVKLNRLQAGKIPTSDSVVIENTTDSQTKASAAQTAAASDATTKANAAQTAAASDATTKANAGEAAAKAVEVANRFTVPANSTDGVFSFKIGAADATTYDVFSSGSRTKFSGIATGATVGAVAGTNLLKEDGTTSLTDALIVTSAGTSADTSAVNSVAASTISSGAALGSSANQDSTAAIRNGITTFERDVSDIFWTNISGQMSPTATSYAVTITWRNGSGTSLGTTVITLALASATALSAAVTTSNGASATVSLGGAANTNVLQNTTVTKNGIVCNVRAQIIDGSGWNFK